MANDDHSAGEPDYAAWAGYQTWTLIEAACLLSGVEPTAAQFEKDRKKGGLPTRIYSDLKDAIDLKQIAWIKSRDQFIQGRRVIPSDCVTWAAGRGYSILPQLAHLKGRDPNETPGQRKERLTGRVQEESKKNRSFLKAVASEEGITTSRLKQILGRQDLPISASKTISTRRKPF